MVQINFKGILWLSKDLYNSTIKIQLGSHINLLWLSMTESYEKKEKTKYRWQTLIGKHGIKYFEWHI